MVGQAKNDVSDFACNTYRKMVKFLLLSNSQTNIEEKKPADTLQVILLRPKCKGCSSNVTHHVDPKKLKCFVTRAVLNKS